MIKALLNLRLIYVVIGWVFVIGAWNLFYHDAPAKWIVLFALAWLTVQSCSATYWSYRWQQAQRQWQIIAENTSERLSAVIVSQRQEIEHLQEPWRN